MGADKKKKSHNNKKTITLIAVLLILCVAAAGYLISMVRGGNAPKEAEESGADTAVAAEENAEQTAEQTAEQAAEEAALAAREKAASHVYSHRGAAGDDELTIACYDRVIAAGSKYIEADMVVSNSGTIYLAHDDYAQDMTGIAGYFSGMTDAQIDNTKTRTGNNIYKLTDLFDKYGDSVNYLVDIKYSSNRNFNALANLIREYGNEKNVMVTSFYLDALSPFERNFPDMTKVYLCQDQATFNVALGKDYLDVLSVPAELMTEDNLKAAHEHEKTFSVWTLNSEEEILKAIELGVDTYFTDDTALAIQLEEQYRSE